MPRSRLAYPSFLPRPRTSRFPSFRMPLLAPLLATALAAMAACGSGATNGAGGAPTESASNSSSAPSSGDRVPSATPDRQVNDTLEGVVDQPAKPWQVSQWFNSQPLALEDLRGKVVLVRWFMGPSCPFCSGTAPTLRTLHERYGQKGLTVVGMYHHKEQTPLDPEQVGGWVKQYGYTFPVAIDKDWSTLQSWWLGAHERSFTSVSFLIDKTGVVRRVHLGGKLAEGPELAAMTADIDRLLTM